MRLNPLVLVFLLAVSGLCFAQIERQHDAHVHGSAVLKLALENTTLELELSAPGMDVVGFEHAPRDAAQEAAITDAIGLLDSGAWLALPLAAACTLESGGFHTHGYKVHAATDADDEHEHGAKDAHSPKHDNVAVENHDHEAHAHEEHGHDAHADFHGTLKYRCAHPVALLAIEISLGQSYPAIAQLTVEIVSDLGQDRVLVPNAIGRVSLPR